MTLATSPGEPSARRFMAIAATLGVLGVALNLSGDSTLPKMVAAAGIISMIWSIHRFGRVGPDAPMLFAEPEPLEAPRKKKKKKKKPADPSSEAPA